MKVSFATFMFAVSFTSRLPCRPSVVDSDGEVCANMDLAEDSVEQVPLDMPKCAGNVTASSGVQSTHIWSSGEESVDLVHVRDALLEMVRASVDAQPTCAVGTSVPA